MSVVEIAIPVTKIVTRLVVRKGRPWSIVERVILESVGAGHRCVAEISAGFGLQPQIVNTSLARLMRADWVQMRVANDELIFSITPAGKRALEQEDLPYEGRTERRSVPLLYDRVAGHVFGLDEIEHFPTERLPTNRSSLPNSVLAPVLKEGMYRLDELIDVALAEDEQLLGADAPAEAGAARLAIVKIVDGRIVGLPTARAFPDLQRAILAITSQGLLQAPRRRSGSTVRAATAQHEIRFERKDLIVGGAEQRLAMEEVFRHARSRIIIHSTFLDEGKVRRLFRPMFDAIERKVSIDILWGQRPRGDDQKKNDRPTAEQIAATLRVDPDVLLRGERLRFHEHSTGSHAKVIVADAGPNGEFVALVGSCNWLASGFGSVEASIMLRTPSIVCDVMRCLTQLVQSANSTHDPLLIDLLRIVQRLQRRSPRVASNARASLVISDAHNDCVLRARDEAKRRIFVASHRMSRKVMPGILVPFAAARAQKALQVTALYGALEGITEQEAERFIKHAADRRIALESIYEPRVHAKVLVWDDNAAVITSQNWLSADPPAKTLATELGVLLEGRNVGELLLERMRAEVARGRMFKRRRTRKRSRR